MILLIDNYDSFTYNIYQYVREFSSNVCVKKNDELNIIFFEGAPLLSTQNEQSNLAYLFYNHWLLKYANLSIFLGLYKGRQLYAHDLFRKGKGTGNKNTKEYFEEKIQKDPKIISLTCFLSMCSYRHTTFATG